MQNHMKAVAKTFQKIALTNLQLVLRMSVETFKCLSIFKLMWTFLKRITINMYKPHWRKSPSNVFNWSFSTFVNPLYWHHMGRGYLYMVSFYIWNPRQYFYGVMAKSLEVNASSWTTTSLEALPNPLIYLQRKTHNHHNHIQARRLQKKTIIVMVQQS